MNALRRVLLWISVGGLVGGLAGSLLGLFFVPKFNAPISGVYAQCDCASVTLGTASAMFKWTLGGMVAGVVVGLVLAVLGAMGAKRKEEPAAGPPKSA
jgi:hypothetical protein